jgi:hypothetical protein
MKRWSWVILGVAAALHLGLLAGWRWQLPLVPYFFDATVMSGRRGLDFYSIYQAGYNARHGRDIYEGDPAQVEVVVPNFTPYRYLPIVAYTVGAPLSLLRPLTAYKAWLVVVELALLGCVAATWRWKRHDQDLCARLAGMWLVFTPYYLELFMGQFSLVQGALIFGMLLLAGTKAPRGQRLFGSLWIASVLWKLNTAVFAPALARMGRWRTLAAAAALVALTTLPYFLIFPAHAGDLWSNNFGNTVTRPELGNLGFRQFVFTAMEATGAGPEAQAWAQQAVVLAVGGTALVLTVRWRAAQGQAAIGAPGQHMGEPTGSDHLVAARSGGRMLRPYEQLAEGGATRVRDLLSLWLAAYFLAAPQVWEHHYVMLLPAIVAAYGDRPSWLLAGLWLMLALPTPFGFTGLQPVIAANHDLRAFAVEPAWMGLAQHAAKALPAVGLFGYWAWRVTRDAQSVQGG